MRKLTVFGPIWTSEAMAETQINKIVASRHVSDSCRMHLNSNCNAQNKLSDRDYRGDKRKGKRETFEKLIDRIWKHGSSGSEK